MLSSLVLPLVSLSLPLVSLSFQPRTYNLSTLLRDSVQIWKIPENNLDVLKFPENNLGGIRYSSAFYGKEDVLGGSIWLEYLAGAFFASI
ncbi:hypothetical protein Tco_0498768 [Tanacetum coccineum]